ncbi:hypothetical protein WBP07_21475 (plasmid) [Novosphingobium sp. BL-8A]|uniref:hypothetical protein n=1 Tax=Novosphingobium sp. BL-8A TaxID=3127639 RepID=UPI003757C2B0
MKKTSAAIAAMIALVSATPAFASDVVLEANGARSEGQWGGELGAGYKIPVFAGLRLTPAAGAFLYKGDNDRYYEDYNGGNERCRDSSNGQYASDSKCNNLAAKFYGRIEATYTIPAAFTFGVGARYMSSEVRPYGTVAVPIAPRIDLKGNAGSHYFAAGLLAHF